MIGLIGNGSWATAIAKILTDNGHFLHWWMRNQKAVDSLNSRGINIPYLSSISFDTGKISGSNNIEEVIGKCETIIICVPSAYLYDILESLPADILKGKTIISAVKGILPNSYLLLNEYLQERQHIDINKYISITGPCHAEEVATELLSYLTFSCKDISLAEEAASWFKNHYMNTTENPDIYGTQYASVLKNIYAVGAGIAHGLGYGDNFMSVYVTNCYKELHTFVRTQFKINSEDKHTSAYLGDLLVTCYSLHSRNRRFGSLLGNGYAIPNAIAEMGMMAEGYHAARGMKVITERHNTSLPILNSIYEILWQNQSPEAGFKHIEDLLQ